jgi:flavodoxin
MKVVVVVYSLTGHTRGIGAEIAQRLDCPIVEITEPRPRRGGFAFLRCAFEALFARLPEIARIDRDLRDFSLLVIGTPVWAGHVASPVRSFLVRHRGEMRSVAAFCTMGGGNPAGTFTDIASACGKTPVATLAISEHELRASRYSPRLDAFVAGISARREGE